MKNDFQELVMLKDADMAELFGKSKDCIQRLLCKMEKHPVAGQYISKSGGRTTDPRVFKKWLLWYEYNKDLANPKPFKLGDNA